MSISLCMIVKNEEENLKRCLESVKDIVDEMIIVDTGSKDSTVPIAKLFGAKVYDFLWTGDFSEARNHSLKFATGDWILLMDADDELEKEDREKVLELTHENSAEAYFFRTISFVDSAEGYDEMQNLNIRLIRNKKGYFFSNPIHEQIYMNIKKITPQAKILNKDIRVYHYGYLNKNIVHQDKRNRNIEILNKELESNPGYSFALFNLGNEYFAKTEYLKAIEYYERAYYKFDPVQGFSSKLILKMANCFMYLGKNEDALAKIAEGLKHYPKFTDLIFIRALIYHFQNKLTLAIESLKTCIQMGESPIDLNILLGSGTYRSHFLLAEILYDFEDFDGAVENYNMSLKYNHKEFAVRKLLKSLCKKKLGQKQLEEQLEKLNEYHIEIPNELLCDIFFQEKYYDLALKYVGRIEKESSALFLQGMCKLMLKKYKSACLVMKTLEEDNKFCAKALCMQALCKILSKNYKQAENLLSSKGVNPEDKMIQTYNAFKSIMKTGEVMVLCEDENGSTAYTDIIFELLRILLLLNEIEIFEKALLLLNTVTDKTVLLRLAKLYYSEGHYKLAFDEFMRSIKIFDLIDTEGANMLYKLKRLGIDS